MGGTLLDGIVLISSFGLILKGHYHTTMNLCYAPPMEIKNGIKQISRMYFLIAIYK